MVFTFIILEALQKIARTIKKANPMKKILLLVVMMTLSLQGAGAHTVESLVNTFSTEKGVEKIHVGKTMMRLGAFFLNDEVRHVSKIAKGIHSVLVLDLDHCSADAKRRFAAAVGSLNDNAYTTVMETNDGDDHVRILGKPDGADLRDVVIISYDRDDCQLVRLKGKVRGKDVRKLIDD